jgi:two-component system chemotaxis response regulator CheY
MLTARDGMEEVVQALEAGADDYLMKPVTAEMLQEKMRMIGLGA